MKKAVPWIRLAFLVLFFVLLRNGLLLVWLLTYLASLLLPLLFGRRLYCVLACPMNTLMLWLNQFKNKLGLRNQSAPAWLAGGKLVWASLALTIAVFVISRKLIGRDFPMMLVWIAVSLGMTLVYHPDVFHDQVCPFGKAQGCLAKQSLLSAEGREQARSYKGFTATVLGGGPEGQGKQA